MEKAILTNFKAVDCWKTSSYDKLISMQTAKNLGILKIWPLKSRATKQFKKVRCGSQYPV